jgi:hypothetical protein
MRTAIATVVLAATVASVAQAQTPPTSTAPAAAPPATTAAPPATTPSTTAPAAAQPAAPAAAAPAAPAATPPAQADQAAAPPTLPTTGPGAVLINVVEKICVPLVRGGNLDQLAPQIQGAKKNRRDGFWTIQLGGASRDYLINIFPVGVNKDVCRGEVHYGFDDEKAIVSAFNVWSFLHQPELILQANYVSVNADGIKRVQKSWEHLDSTSSTAVNFTTWTKPDDTPLAKGYATGEVFYQERKLTQ